MDIDEPMPYSHLETSRDKGWMHFDLFEESKKEESIDVRTQKTTKVKEIIVLDDDDDDDEDEDEDVIIIGEKKMIRASTKGGVCLADNTPWDRIEEWDNCEDLEYGKHDLVRDK